MYNNLLTDYQLQNHPRPSVQNFGGQTWNLHDS